MTKARCPVCKKPFDSEGSDSMPFCSERCRNIDLNRWLIEDYALPCNLEDEMPEDEMSENESSEDDDDL